MTCREGLFLKVLVRTFAGAAIRDALPEKDSGFDFKFESIVSSFHIAFKMTL